MKEILMIIEKLIAFTGVKIAWEILDILHLVQVGHIVGEAIYKVGGSAVSRFKRSYQELLDKKDPTQREIHEATTIPYDFKATVATPLYNDIPTQVENYLVTLEYLQSAKNYLVTTNVVVQT